MTTRINFTLSFAPTLTTKLIFENSGSSDILLQILSIYPTPLLGQDMTQGQFFKWSLTGLNSEFSFSYTSCLTKAGEPSLSYYLPIAWGRIIGFIPFPRVLVLCEMQWVLSRNWTRIAVSISCDNNHYTTGTSILLEIYNTNSSRLPETFPT